MILEDDNVRSDRTTDCGLFLVPDAIVMNHETGGTGEIKCFSEDEQEAGRSRKSWKRNRIPRTCGAGTWGSQIPESWVAP